MTATGLRYTPTLNRSIVWPGGATTPPLDSPVCGFFNENPECDEKGILTKQFMVPFRDD